VIYCDTAYLARLYLLEHGSTEVRSVVQSSSGAACCALGQAELASAFHRKWREGRISKEDFSLLLKQLDSDCACGLHTWFPVTAELLAVVRKDYRSLPTDVFLRASDALHLACARDNAFKEIYSNDEQMLAAAPYFGLKGKNVIP